MPDETEIEIVAKTASQRWVRQVYRWRTVTRKHPLFLRHRPPRQRTTPRLLRRVSGDSLWLRIEPVENKCFHEPSILFACMHLVCLLLGKLAVFADDFLGGLFALGFATER